MVGTVGNKSRELAPEDTDKKRALRCPFSFALRDDVEIDVRHCEPMHPFPAIAQAPGHLICLPALIAAQPARFGDPVHEDTRVLRS